MSIKNKAKDRNTSGRICRKYTAQKPTFNLRHTPTWWVNLFMTRPRRRDNRRLCAAILRDADPDGVAFPLGSRKPHSYYW